MGALDHLRRQHRGLARLAASITPLLNSEDLAAHGTELKLNPCARLNRSRLR